MVGMAGLPGFPDRFRRSGVTLSNIMERYRAVSIAAAALVLPALLAEIHSRILARSFGGATRIAPGDLAALDRPGQTIEAVADTFVAERQDIRAPGPGRPDQAGDGQAKAGREARLCLFDSAFRLEHFQRKWNHFRGSKSL
jgi:hypothetical protein